MFKKYTFLRERSVVVSICTNSNRNLVDIENWVIDNNAIFFPLSFILARKYLNYIVKNCFPEYIITDSKMVYKWLEKQFQLYPEYRTGINLVFLSTDFQINKIEYKNSQIRSVNWDRNLQYILTTSGTTSLPKLVALSGEKTEKCFNHFSQTKVIQNSEKYLNILPLYFSGGRKVHHSCLQAGVKIVYLQPRQSIQNIIESEKIDITAGTPYILENILKENIFFKRTLKFICGGAFLSENIIRKANASNIEVYNVYGLTETTSILSYNDINHFSPHSVGKISNLNEVKFDENNGISVRGINICMGYINDGEIQKVTDEQGWFQTGDKGILDENGYLFLKGRSDRRIKKQDGTYMDIEYVKVVVNFYLTDVDIEVHIVDNQKILLLIVLNGESNYIDVNSKIVNVLKKIEREELIHIHYYCITYQENLKVDNLKGNIDLTSLKYVYALKE